MPPVQNVNYVPGCTKNAEGLRPSARPDGWHGEAKPARDAWTLPNLRRPPDARSRRTLPLSFPRKRESRNSTSGCRGSSFSTPFDPAVLKIVEAERGFAPLHDPMRGESPVRSPAALPSR